MAESSLQKIKNLAELGKIARNLKKQGKKIVLCHGVFDLVHPGHIRHFTSAKKYGDVLIVSITADEFVKKGPGRPIFHQDLRAEVLASIQIVDYVTIVSSFSAMEVIKKLKPDFYVKGPDYKSRKTYSTLPQKLLLEKTAMEEMGGKLVYTDDPVVYSSSALINSYLDTYPPDTKKYLTGLRSKYTGDDILEKLNSLETLKILVIGDAIIDQYHYCAAMGKSSKEPVVVHNYIAADIFIGGAIATVNHLAALSHYIELVTVLGQQNSFETFIRKHLKKQVIPKFFYKPKSRTTVKRRFLDKDTKQKLFQIEYLEDKPLPSTIESRILNYLKKNLNNFDLVLANDFGHGVLTGKIINYLCRKAKYLAINVQANSANYGFNVVTKYSRADFICIDEQEIRLATHNKYSDLKDLMKDIYHKLNCKFMIVTKGSEGSIAFRQKDGFYVTPALAEKVVDRVGAGDALFAIAAPCVHAGFESDLTAFIGNVAGALQVATVGNKYPVEFSDLAKFIIRLMK